MSTILRDFPNCLPSRSRHLFFGHRWFCLLSMALDRLLTWQIWQHYFYFTRFWNILSDYCFMCVPTIPGDINPHKPDFQLWWSLKARPQPTQDFNTVIKTVFMGIRVLTPAQIPVKNKKLNKCGHVAWKGTEDRLTFLPLFTIIMQPHPLLCFSLSTH